MTTSEAPEEGDLADRIAERPALRPRSMASGVIGVSTTDFSLYYDLLRALRERGLPFVDFPRGEEVPAQVAVVLTTPEEAPEIFHSNVVPATDAASAVLAAERALAGLRMLRRVIVGIDPGERPGIAVLGDGKVLSTTHAPTPEAVAATVESALATFPAEEFVVRIGDGAPTQRDRIIATLLPLDAALELVDERRSTPASYSTNAERDIAAAKAIALAPGIPIEALGEIRPSGGEIRDIQRKSRIASEGEFTISRGLARAVALGRLSLDEAVAWQKRRQTSA